MEIFLFEGIHPTHKQIDPIYKLYYLYAEAFYWLTPKGHTISLCPLWLTDSIFDTKNSSNIFLVKFQKFQNPFYLPTQFLEPITWKYSEDENEPVR